MKISKETLAILKNFAGINSNLMIQKGNSLKTISPQRNVFANVSVSEEFDVDFGIYDLNQFLGVVSLFTDPDITFGEKVAVLKEGKTSIKYYAADKSVLLLPPEKTVKFPSVDAEFTLTGDVISSIMKTSAVLSAPDVSIIGDGSVLKLVVSDLKNSSTNAFEAVIGETDKTFTANLKVDNLKMIVQDYDVQLTSKKLSKWTAKTGDMTVYVALESTSSF